jgi:hypothetical protein
MMACRRFNLISPCISVVQTDDTGEEWNEIQWCTPFFFVSLRIMHNSVFSVLKWWLAEGLI